ncbi:MAG TPA: lamin tail domain-containing protein [Planctomycetota bacterium]|nr:lamin tail domain-containing protein [Planctomycetota bacterium]
MTHGARGAACLLLLVAEAAAQGPVLINEIHGFGSGATPPLQGDYLELRNVASTPVDLSGWTLGMFNGDTGALVLRAFPPRAVIEGHCFLVLQEGGSFGDALADPQLPAGTRGMKMGSAIWASNSSMGCFLVTAGGACSDYVYLRRAGTPAPAAPHLASAGVGATWTPGNVAASGSGQAHLKRIVDADTDGVADWSQSATANHGTPGALNVGLGAAQTASGACTGTDGFGSCVGGQQNQPDARLTINGLGDGAAPGVVELLATVDTLHLKVRTTTPALAAATFFLAFSPTCNAGHFLDGAGQKFDLGAPTAGFCDVDVVSPATGFTPLCGGGPFTAFGALVGGQFDYALPLSGVPFGRTWMQVAVVDASAPLGMRLSAAIGTSSHAGELLAAGAAGFPLPIPDGVGVPGVGPTATSTLTQATSLVLTDVDVVLQLNHTWYGDLNVSLSHGGTTVTLLVAGTPDVNSDFVGTTRFSDEGYAPADHAVGGVVIPKYALRPDAPLSAFDGQDAGGTWTLSLSDNFLGDSGTLLGWSLIFNGDR